MHRALLINEVVEGIIKHLVTRTSGGTHNDTATLSSLARTCYALSESALDMIWVTPHLWNLAHTMDRDLRMVTTVERHQELEQWVRIEVVHTMVSTIKLYKES
jgi:hypothetical protein